MVKVHITLFCFFRTNSNGLSRDAAESAEVFFLYFILLFYLSPQPASLPFSPPTPLLSEHKLSCCCSFIALILTFLLVLTIDLRDDKLLPLSLQAILLQQHLQDESLK